jgi:hypothetical protein
VSRKSIRKKEEKQYWSFMLAALGIIVVMSALISLVIYLNQDNGIKQVENSEDIEWVASTSARNSHKEKTLEEQIIKDTRRHRLTAEKQKELDMAKVRPAKGGEQHSEPAQETVLNESVFEVATEDKIEASQAETTKHKDESNANSELQNVASENDALLQESVIEEEATLDPSENSAPILKEVAPVTDAEPAYSLPIQLFMLDQNTGENIGPNGVLDGNLGELWRLKKPKEVDLSTGEKMLLVRAVQEVTYLDGHTETIELNPFEDTYGKFDGSYTNNTIYMYYEDQLAPRK